MPQASSDPRLQDADVQVSTRVRRGYDLVRLTNIGGTQLHPVDHVWANLLGFSREGDATFSPRTLRERERHADSHMYTHTHTHTITSPPCLLCGFSCRSLGVQDWPFSTPAHPRSQQNGAGCLSSALKCSRKCPASSHMMRATLRCSSRCATVGTTCLSLKRTSTLFASHGLHQQAAAFKNGGIS